MLQTSQFIRFFLLWRPPSTPSAILHNGDVLLRSAVAELGIFGTFVAKGEEVTCNKAPFLDQFARASGFSCHVCLMIATCKFARLLAIYFGPKDSKRIKVAFSLAMFETQGMMQQNINLNPFTPLFLKP